VNREVVIETRVDPKDEIAESNWPKRGGYKWVVPKVELTSKFRCSATLKSWYIQVWECRG